MHKILKYYNRLFSFLDISPIEPGGITKFMLYTIWGINALLFLGKDIDFTCEYKDFSAGSNISIQCTVLKKVSTTDLYNENYTFVNQTDYVVILPYDYTLPICDVISRPRDRSPPYMLFS